MRKTRTIGIVLMGTLLLGGAGIALGCATCGCSAPATKASTKEKAAATKSVDGKTGATKKVKPQTICPVMGGKIDKNVYVDVKGVRIYMCCKGCAGKIKADPEKYIAKIKQRGETPEKLPVVLCGKCGQIKGTSECCAKDGKKCGKCGLAKGAPGCCKIEKGKDATLCSGCGQVKGSEECCAKEAAKCKKCGLHKGSPGCCKTKK